MSLEPDIESVDADAFAGQLRQRPAGSVRRASVEVTADEHLVVELAAAALARHPHLYQRANMLVHVLRDPAEGGRDRAAPRIAEVAPALLRTESTRVVYWFKTVWDKKRDEAEPVQVHPPQPLVAALHARGHWPGVRALEGISEVPVLRPDGSVCEQPGYDAATGVLYEPNGSFPSVPAAPSRADVAAAVALLREPFADFPFRSEAHRAGALAALLTPIARHAFRGCAPLFLLDANTPGAGKSLGADVISEVVAGRPMARMAPSDDDNEMRKRITALALAGAAFVLLDNVAGGLGGPALDAALTSTTWRDRLLGVSRDVELPLRAVWYATGNNVQLAGDMARRTVHIRIESPLENPERRAGFRHPDLLAWVREHRGALVAAGLTLLAAYLHAGAPDQRLAPWGSFDGWTRVVRGALVWAGEPDPGAAREELRQEADAASGALAELLDGWTEIAARYGGQCTVAQALGELQRNDALAAGAHAAERVRYEDLRSALAQLCNAPPGKLPTAKAMGKALAKHRGRVLGGRALGHPAVQTDRKGTLIWTVRAVAAPDAGSAESAGCAPGEQNQQTKPSSDAELKAPPGLPGTSPTLTRESNDFEKSPRVETNPAQPANRQRTLRAPDAPPAVDAARDDEGDPAWSLPPEEDF